MYIYTYIYTHPYMLHGVHVMTAQHVFYVDAPQKHINLVSFHK